MLNDLRWGGPSRISFISWLETKDPKQRYDFLDCRGACLMGQYMAYLGHEWNGIIYEVFCAKVLGEHYRTVLEGKPQTFGGALRRARELV